VGEDSARFVAALDTSIARGDLHTDSQDLAHLLSRPPTTLADAVREAHARTRHA
jgi:NAD(P)H dehydrogenase (quinone)